MVGFALVISIPGQLISFGDHFKQHLFQLRKADAVVGLQFQHFPDDALDIAILDLPYFLVEKLEVDAVGVEIVEMLHILQVDHVKQSNSKGENTRFVGQSTHKALLFEHPQSLRRVVKVLLLVKIEQVTAKSATQHLANALLIDDDILRSESVMQDLILIEVRQRKDATAKNAHKLLLGEVPLFRDSALNFVEDGVALVLEVLSQSVLFGAEVGLGDDLAVECIEVELMGEGVVGFVAFHVLVELLLRGEGVLDDHRQFLRELVSHQGSSLLQLAHEFVALELGPPRCAIPEGYCLAISHLSIIIINEQLPI